MSNARSHPPGPGVDRRSFLKGIGTSAVAVATVQARALAGEIDQAAGPDGAPLGPGAVPVTLTINGAKKDFQLEPRVTLLDALRNFGPLTGTKEVCDRGTCGACTVLVDGKPVYSCMKLAIEMPGREITTIEGLAPNGQLTPVQQAFIDCDALMCGFCTPGFVLAATALLQENPHPTEADVRHGCAGNLCRCGAYAHILQAVQKAGGADLKTDPIVVTYDGVA
jgi:aerobic-type carbon monoxide dehydrogenase small subunit (CoxS/CutS family)